MCLVRRAKDFYLIFKIFPTTSAFTSGAFLGIKFVQLSFPVIHKVGNVDNFVLPKFANK